MIFFSIFEVSYSSCVVSLSIYAVSYSICVVNVSRCVVNCWSLLHRFSKCVRCRVQVDEQMDDEWADMEVLQALKGLCTPHPDRL